MATTSTVLPTLVSLVALTLYALYRRLRPKPIPTIPYNPEAAHSLLGDIPGLLRAPEPVRWLNNQVQQSGSPIFQVFTGLAGKPLVLLTDFRESQDIQLRRKEFDRSDFLINAFKPIAPYHHIVQKTNAVWKSQRRLLQDLMTPSFLHKVAAPNMYASATTLVELWRRKADLAAGRPFNAQWDMNNATLDAVLEFSFGRSYPHRATRPQLDLVKSLSASEIQRMLDEADRAAKPVEFAKVPLHESSQATLDLVHILENMIRSPSRTVSWWFKKKSAHYKRISKLRDDFMKDQVLKAVDRMGQHGADGGDDWVRCAVDLIMDREKRFAEKDGRQPVYWSEVTNAEIFGFIVAGHDTTSGTVSWGLKLVADNPDAQTKLRSELEKAHAAALAEGRSPSVNEIVDTSIPYLEATIEETLRCGGTVPLITRSCDVDTVVLGHVIPKGTTVMMFNQGASFTAPARNIDEETRSPTCQTAAKERKPREWDPQGMDKFYPERWLVTSEQGSSFDATAGPTMPFGLGVRGCYGRRLAYLSLRILWTMIIWNFELLPCPSELSGYGTVDGLTIRPKQAYVRLRKIVR